MTIMPTPGTTSSAAPENMSTRGGSKRKNWLQAQGRGEIRGREEARAPGIRGMEGRRTEGEPRQSPASDEHHQAPRLDERTAECGPACAPRVVDDQRPALGRAHRVVLRRVSDRRHRRGGNSRECRFSPAHGRGRRTLPSLPHQVHQAGMRANGLPAAAGSRERGGIVRARARLPGQVHRGGGGARSPGGPPAGSAVHRMGDAELFG